MRIGPYGDVIFSGVMTKVLIVDDEPVQLRLTEEVATRAGFNSLTARDGNEALSLLRTDPSIRVMILDLIMPELDGMGVLETMRREDINVPVIVQTANSSMETIVSAMRAGATDFFVKPVAPERITISLNNALQLDHLESCVRTERARIAGTIGINDIVTHGPEMDRVITLVQKAAKSTIPVLIEGETGVGKELIARAIQGTGERAGKPFVTVNCGAIPPNLVESTLFGHVKGAFTGAHADHTGKFEEAHGGTLFLDEVGELPLETQVKLLRALQEGEVEPVGANRAKRVNVRVISATNRRLLNMAKDGSFREDLYYRLNVFPIYVPPLRERMSDIASLVEHFIAKLGAEAARKVRSISPDALALLKSHDWPGNIRQLENAIYRAIVLAETTQLEREDFPQILSQTAGRSETADTIGTAQTMQAPIHVDAPLVLTSQQIAPSALMPASDRFLTAEGEIAAISEIERDLIAFALERHNGHMSQIARALGIGRSTLYRKLKEYGLEESPTQNAA